MCKEIIGVLQGYIYWLFFKLKYLIHYKKVVLILADENEKLDLYALLHLEEWMERKFVKEAIVFVNNRKKIKDYCFNYKVTIIYISEEKIKKLYDVYCFYKFFDNIAFTYISIPKDNLLGQALEIQDIDEEVAVCLGLYHLRKV